MTIIDVPMEFTISGVYFPPLLIVAFFGFFAALITTKLLNRYRLSRYLFYPPLAFLAIAVIYTLIFGTIFIKI